MNEESIIYEDNNIIVVNKKAGLITEKNPYETNTVEDFVMEYLSTTHKKSFVGVIHRLDRVTSGVLIFAKKKSVLKVYNQLFSQRNIQKTYLAIVENKPEYKQKKLENYLLKSISDKKSIVSKASTPNAKKAELYYEVLKETQQGFLLKIKPKTGRFHQIRAQLAYIGLTIIGDVKYGSNIKYYNNCIALHAYSLSYTNPINNKKDFFKATIPKNDFWI